jgi:hypothetical protein
MVSAYRLASMGVNPERRRVILSSFNVKTCGERRNAPIMFGYEI